MVVVLNKSNNDTNVTVITNTGRLISDLLLNSQAIRENIKSKDKLASLKEVQDTFRQLSQLWRKIAYRQVSEESLEGETRQKWTLEFLKALGYKNLIDGEAIDTEKGELKPFKQWHLNSNEPPILLLDLIAFSEDPDNKFKYKDYRGTHHKKMELMLTEVESAGNVFGFIISGTKLRVLKRDTTTERRYLEFDTDFIFNEQDEESFEVLYQLLRSEALKPGADGELSVIETIIEESEKIGTSVGKELGLAANKALEKFLDGILQDQENSKANWDNQSLKDYLKTNGNLENFYQEGLKYLFRLLFIFYAESWELLPVTNIIYRDNYSFEKERDPLFHSENYHTNEYYLWNKFKALFSLINSGFDSTEIKVPPYNGGLFKPENSPIIEKCQLNDEIFRDVLFELTTIIIGKGVNRQRENVSFRDLGVEQLGSIYEGLLTYEPKIATETMARYTQSDTTTTLTLEQFKKSDYKGEPEKLEAGHFYLYAWGGRRKGSGSYYTPEVITKFLVKEALEPITEEIIQKCEEGKAKPDDILEIKVCDPAMGSGAFLVAATKYLAEQYGRAMVASGFDEDGKTDNFELSIYRRKVVENCIYGVDKNPMAVELAKVSLWLTTLAEDRALTFLDHRLRCGNSLVGASLRDLKTGKIVTNKIDHLPSEALTNPIKKPAKNDLDEDKERYERLKIQRAELIKKNKEEVKDYEKGQLSLFKLPPKVIEEMLQEVIQDRKDLDEIDENLVMFQSWASHKRKEQKFHWSLSRVKDIKALCDLWCSAWFWPEDAELPPPTTSALQAVATYLVSQEGSKWSKSLMAIELLTLDQKLKYVSLSKKIAEKYSFFHWELEFPEVFMRENPGFDVILGNPPWDLVQKMTQEFYSNYDNQFRNYNKQKAIKIMKSLRLDNEEISSSWDYYEYSIECYQNYYKSDLNYPNAGKGDANLFRLFLEKTYNLQRLNGVLNFVIPSGFYTDLSCMPLRKLFLDTAQINFLISLENRGGIFPIDSRFKFILLSLIKEKTKSKTELVNCAYFVGKQPDPNNPEEFIDRTMNEDGLKKWFPGFKDKLLKIKTKDIIEFSPSSYSFMEFNNQQEIDITSKMYKFPILAGGTESWNVEFHRELHKSDDSALWEGHSQGVPVYEGKNIYQFNNKYQNISLFIPQEKLLKYLKNKYPKTEKYDYEYLRCAYRAVASNTNEITLISCLIPKYSATVHSLNTLKPESVTDTEALYLSTLLNSFLNNFITRQKITTNLTMDHMYQLPIPKPDPEKSLIKDILTLSKTFYPDIFDVSESNERKDFIRAKIDALIAKFYGLDIADYKYILNTFPLLDRDQKALPGEKKSTITRDLALLEFYKVNNHTPPDELANRVDEAIKIGAQGYIPTGKEQVISEMAELFETE